jgi:sialic acid synthase SpsE
VDLNLSCFAACSDLVGFSDHTRDVRMGAWAVCAGARVLEVHYRADDTSPENPDYAASLTPAELREYIRQARTAMSAMGYRVKQCMPSEEGNRRYRYADR